MAIYNHHMAISVTKFKNSCLDVIRRVETTGQSVSITRRGKVVARLAPSFQATENAEAKPWQKLRALGGELLAQPGESVVDEEDFEALR
jgi:prevent-host-death family protein